MQANHSKSLNKRSRPLWIKVYFQAKPLQGEYKKPKWERTILSRLKKRLARLEAKFISKLNPCKAETKNKWERATPSHLTKRLARIVTKFISKLNPCKADIKKRI